MIMRETHNVYNFIILSDAIMLRTETWVERKEVFVGKFAVSGNNLGHFVYIYIYFPYRCAKWILFINSPSKHK